MNDEHANATVSKYTAGETLVPGDFVYQLSTDNEVYKADASTAAKSNAIGMSLTYGDDGDPVRILTAGKCEPGGTLVAAETYGASDNGGKLRPVADNGSGDYATVYGVAEDTAILEVNINVSNVAKA